MAADFHFPGILMDEVFISGMDTLLC